MNNTNFEVERTVDFMNSFFGFNLSDKSRKKEIVEARMMYAKIMKRHTRLSLAAIGRAINKDHATIIHYLNNFSWFKKSDVAFSNRFDLLTEMYDEFRETWIDDTKYEEDRKVFFLEKTVERLSEQKETYEKYIKRIQRIDSIVQLIEQRTPRGEEEYVEGKINRMFNAIVFNP